MVGLQGWSCYAVKKSYIIHNPAMIAVDCVAHRLALAASQAADSIPYIKKFKGHISQIFKYHYSTVLSILLLLKQ